MLTAAKADNGIHASALRPSASRDARRSAAGVAIRDICTVNIEKRVKLKGVLERTASSIEIKGDGSLVVEVYDFSDEAEQWFGNDVAFLLKVSSADKSRMLSCLMAGQHEADSP